MLGIPNDPDVCDEERARGSLVIRQVPHALDFVEKLFFPQEPQLEVSQQISCTERIKLSA